MDPGGLLWFLALVAGTIVLGVAFAFGIAQYRRRNRRLDPLRDAATAENYAAEDRRSRETGAG